MLRLILSAFVLGIPEHKLRVIAPDVGGGFGSKIFCYDDETMVTGRRAESGVRSSGRPSAANRSMTDAHGRDHVTHAELALDKDGKFLALKVETIANMGAYLSTFSTRGADLSLRHAAGRPVHDAAHLRQREGRR